MAPLKKFTHVRVNRTYKCRHCSMVLSDQSALESHIETHSDDFPYSCTICTYKCKVKKYLGRHMKKVHLKPNGPHCPVCDKVFHFNSALKKHMRVHTGEKPYQCPVCDKAFSSPYCLSMHKMIHTDEKPYQCNFCDYACRDNSTLRRHEERHMGIMKTYPCDKCKRIFKTNARLKLHKDEAHYGIETRRFPCAQCGKAFKTTTAMKLHVKAVHEKRHTTECEICGRTISKSNVLNHMKCHIDIRPFKCNICPSTFKDKSSLKKHTLIHYPEYQHECTICGTKFARRIRMKRHMRLHAADENYICDYCGVSFAKKFCLINHIRKKHPKCDRFVCDLCDSVDYSRRAIILHLKYGHGTEYDRKCKICASVSLTSDDLKEHYLKLHNIRYVIMKSRDEKIVIKEEPVEVCAEFDFNYDVQKTEIEDQRLPEPNYMETSTNLAYTEKQLEESSRTTIEVDLVRPQSEFDKFFAEQIMNKPIRKEIDTINIDPECIDLENNFEYSEKVLEEDISRTFNEKEKEESPETYDEFFQTKILKKPPSKDLPNSKINRPDKRKLADAKKTIANMLNESKIRKESAVLEIMRRKYNIRIQIAYERSGHKDPTQIKYFKVPESSQFNNNLENENNLQENNGNESNHNQIDKHTQNEEVEQRNEETIQQNEEIIQQNEETIQQNEETIQQNKESIEQNGESKQNGEIDQQNEETELQNVETELQSDKIGENEEDDASLDMPLSLRKKKRKKSKIERFNSGKNQKHFESNENENQSNGKMKIIGQECYICFRLFKTKQDLKDHCIEHFDVCNEKMLKKCPFCGYVTNKNMKRHMELVHKFNVNYAYGQIMEKKDQTGSKYVFEIDKNCELEIIPSINSLNKIACMKMDEKNRENKNIFIGKTKIVKKGDQWVVEKQAINVTNEYLLPEFSDEEYQKLKSVGISYIDRLKNLYTLAKKRGAKMLFPCEGCEKICQTASALKLHNRKHEENPKKFKPKVWVNRHIEYKTKNRKKIRISNKTRNKLKEKAAAKKSMKNMPKVMAKSMPKKTRVYVDSGNRFASPQPVKNNHKCDKELIKFYQSNIRGGDIEFWQFLKIFNKMSRENVNDFEDLENRNDVHFGIHVNEKPVTHKLPVNVDTEPVNTRKKRKTTKPVNTYKEPVLPKNTKPVNTDKEPVLSKNTKPVNTDKEPVLPRYIEPINADREPKIIRKESVLPKNIGKIKKNSQKPFTRAIMISKQEYMRRNEIKNQMRKKLQENK